MNPKNRNNALSSIAFLRDAAESILFLRKKGEGKRESEPHSRSPKVLRRVIDFFSGKQTAESSEEPGSYEMLTLKRSTKSVLKPSSGQKQHRFLKGSFDSSSKLSWCDICGNVIWSTDAFQTCAGCTLTCHSSCQPDVSTSCCLYGVNMETSFASEHSGESETESSAIQNNSSECFLNLRNNIENILNKANAILGQNKFRLVENVNQFQGLIHVEIRLKRPVHFHRQNVLFEHSGSFQPFYIPLGTVKVAHIQSDTPAFDVVKILLDKFRICDYPRKFTLCERFYDPAEQHQVFKKLKDDDLPLVHLLKQVVTTRAPAEILFILIENETDIDWDEFSIPELQNFLRMLDIEEENQIKSLTGFHHQLKEATVSELNKRSDETGNHRDLHE